MRSRRRTPSSIRTPCGQVNSGSKTQPELGPGLLALYGEEIRAPGNNENDEKIYVWDNSPRGDAAQGCAASTPSFACLHWLCYSTTG